MKNKTTRFERILIATLLPVPLGVFIFAVFGNAFSQPDIIKGLLVFTLFGYVIIGIPSVIYSLIMEYIVNPKIKNNFLVVCISTLLGMLSGTPLVATGIIIGTIVGLFMGILLRWVYLQTYPNK